VEAALGAFIARSIRNVRPPQTDAVLTREEARIVLKGFEGRPPCHLSISATQGLTNVSLSSKPMHLATRSRKQAKIIVEVDGNVCHRGLEADCAGRL
jgi:hypothetical protein